MYLTTYYPISLVAQLQNFNSTLFGTLPPDTIYFTDLTCPPGASDLSLCEGNFTQCPVGAGAVLSCASRVRGKICMY